MKREHRPRKPRKPVRFIERAEDMPDFDTMSDDEVIEFWETTEVHEDIMLPRVERTMKELSLSKKEKELEKA